MKKKISIILLAALGFCSCEERFELNDVGGEPRMYVECYAGLADTTIVQLYKAMPVNAKASDGRDYTLRRLDLKVNGTPVSLKPLSDLYYTDSPIAAGSQLSLEVETAETAPVSATTTVPNKPAFTMAAEMIGGPVMPYIQFTIDFQGAIEASDRYGIGIKQYIKTHRDDGSDDVEYDMSAAPTMINGDIALEHSLTVMGYPESFHFGMFSGEDVEDGKRINAIMMYDPREYTWEEIQYDDDGNETGTVTVTLSLKFQIQILRFSEESYGYLNSLYNRQENLLAMLGFCPPTVAYTNISGGYGVLGGLSLAESEIIDIADLL